jgi:hypothetical protein
MTPKKLLIAVAAVLIVASSSPAAVFVVPPDADMVKAADMIVVGRASSARGDIAYNGDITTITTFEVERILKGDSFLTEVNVRDLGGEVYGRAMGVSGGVSYRPGERVLIFLQRDRNGDWTTYGMSLGKFNFARDRAGNSVLVRWLFQSDALTYDASMRPYHDNARDAEGFIRNIEGIVSGANRSGNSRRRTVTSPGEPSVSAELNEGSYTVVDSGPYVADQSIYPPSAYTQGNFRWIKFDSGGSATFYVSGRQPGYDDIGAAQRGLAAWTNDPQSNVNYVYGGMRTATFAQDGFNTIVYNSSSDVPAGAIGYSKWYASGSHTYKGETFYTTTEGDVVMKAGLTISQAAFDEAVTHELGHTLGFRHSDQGTPASSDAVMNSVVSGTHGARLAQWDIDAVSTVYTGASNPPPPPPPSCTAPTVTASASPASITSGQSSTLTATPTGTAPFNYQWYVGTSGTTSSPISGGNTQSIAVSPTSTTNYWVIVSNSCGNANSNTVTVTVTVPPPPPPARRAVHGDYNGDGRTDPTFFRPSNGIWAPYNVKTVAWGVSTDKPVPADYDGDLKTDIAVYRPSTGDWLISYSSNGSSVTVRWGNSSDVPVPADYDGDGRADIAIYRASESKWYIVTSSNGGTRIVTWGGYGDTPVPADYDGDRKADIAVYREQTGQWLIINSSNGTTRVVTWGGIGDTPVPADYDGDGKDDIAVWRSSDGTWYIIRSSNGTTDIFTWGSRGDIPVPGDYNGDGRYDPAIFRPSESRWYIASSSGTQLLVWGQSGDIPLSK